MDIMEYNVGSRTKMFQFFFWYIWIKIVRLLHTTFTDYLFALTVRNENILNINTKDTTADILWNNHVWICTKIEIEYSSKTVCVKAICVEMTQRKKKNKTLSLDTRDEDMGKEMREGKKEKKQ